MGGHLGVPRENQLVLRGEVGQQPAHRDRPAGVQGGVGVQPGIGAVVEVVDLQLLEMARPGHRLEQGGAQLGVVLHGAAGVHQQNHLHRVLAGLFIAHL